jgi:MFS family permease
VLRERDLRLFVAARFSGGTAQMMLRATIAWQVYEITGSALQLGLIGAVQFVPTVVLSLLAGAVADSYDRRRIVMAAQAVALLCSVTLLALSWTGVSSLSAIYAVIFVAAAASSFENPAASSLLPTLVSRSEFPSAAAVQASVRNLAWVTGPTAMGFAVDAFGVGGAYAAHGVLIALSISLLAFIRPRPRSGEARGVTIEAIREGIAFVRGRPAILGAMTLDMLAVIFGAAEALLPVFAKDVLQVGPRGFGILSASFQVGTLLMALVLVALPPIQRAGRALLWSVAAYSLATIGFGLSKTFALSVAALGGVGMADQVSMVTRSTLIQLSTPDELRGRVNSVNFIFIGASNHLGAVEAGVVAALTSASFAVVSGGFVALAITGFMAWSNRALRTYDVRS